jgi:branched-subunit amino acid transport protein AzlD
MLFGYRATWALFIKVGFRAYFTKGSPFIILQTLKKNRFVENIWVPKSLLKLYLWKCF